MTVLQVVYGALVLGAGEGVYLLVRWLRRRSKRSNSGPRTGTD
jgi:hypothetical protein